MLIARFIRHGESAANAGEATSDPAAVPLTSLGWEQAQALPHSFADPPDLIVSSPFLRARETAAPTARRFPSVPLEVWPVQEFTYLAPSRCVNTTGDRRKPWTDAYWQAADPHKVDGPGAESFADLVARARAASDRITSLPYKSVALFSHGLFMRVIRWQMSRGPGPVSAADMTNFRDIERDRPIPNGASVVAIWDGKRWTIEV